MDAFFSESIVAFNYDMSQSNNFVKSTSNKSYFNPKQLIIGDECAKSTVLSRARASDTRQEVVLERLTHRPVDGGEQSSIKIPLIVKNKQRPELHKSLSNNSTPMLSSSTCSETHSASSCSSLMSVTTTTIMAKAKQSDLNMLRAVSSNATQGNANFRLIPLVAKKAATNNEDSNFQLISSSIQDASRINNHPVRPKKNDSIVTSSLPSNSLAISLTSSSASSSSATLSNNQHFQQHQQQQHQLKHSSLVAVTEIPTRRALSSKQSERFVSYYTVLEKNF